MCNNIKIKIFIYIFLGTWILPDPVEKTDPQAGTSGSNNSSATSTVTTSTSTVSTTTSGSNATSTSTIPNKETKHSKDTGSNASEDGGTGTIKTELGAQAKPTKPPTKPEDAVVVNKPPAHFVNYYLQIARVIIVCSNENLLKVGNMCLIIHLYVLCFSPFNMIPNVFSHLFS